MESRKYRLRNWMIRDRMCQKSASKLSLMGKLGQKEEIVVFAHVMISLFFCLIFLARLPRFENFPRKTGCCFSNISCQIGEFIRWFVRILNLADDPTSFGQELCKNVTKPRKNILLFNLTTLWHTERHSSWHHFIGHVSITGETCTASNTLGFVARNDIRFSASTPYWGEVILSGSQLNKDRNWTGLGSLIFIQHLQKC